MSLAIDHVCWLVPDGKAEVERLRREHGLGAERGMYYPRAGTQHWNIWLRPPQYLEVLSIVNRQDAATGPDGAQVLACEAAGFGLFSWAVLVDDLDAVSRRLGLPVQDYTKRQPDGTLRGWRTVSGPWHLPFFIDYPRNGDRVERLEAGYERVGHDVAPAGFAALHVEGDEEEMGSWLGPHALPLTFRPGTGGLRQVEIATATGPLLLPG